jgi:glyoxylase-like metal-dependent hydrolase (beta-lactamase superfamily II)
VNPVSIEQRVVGPLQVLTYLVRCTSTGEAVIIDPGGEEERLAEWASSATVRWILNTHGHGDHVAGNERLSQLLRVPCALHGADIDAFGLASRMTCQLRRLADGDWVHVGKLQIKVLHTPGHTPGGVCFHLPGHLFTGDTLFVGAVGRTDLVGASLKQLLSSIEGQILPLPDATVVWPGHDYGDQPRSTLGRERRENPYITDLILSSS